MKRDMNLIRAILLKLEEHKHGFPPADWDIEGYSQDVIGFHIHLMGEAGLIKAADITPMGATSPMGLAQFLKWDGYEFLEAARNETIWSNATKTFAASGVGITLEVLKTWLIAEAHKKLGL